MNSQKSNHIDDKELLQNFYADHSNEWLGILLPRYTLLLFGVCMKYLKNEEDAKDCVQQIFFKAISELHKYRVEYFKSWIYMVAKNHCLMKLRDKTKYPVEINEKISVAPDTDPGKDLFLEKDYALEEMGKALAQLNNEQQQCITLFYLEKRSYVDIAAKTGLTLMQVKSNIQNGKRNLKLLLEKKLKHG